MPEQGEKSGWDKLADFGEGLGLLLAALCSIGLGIIGVVLIVQLVVYGVEWAWGFAS